MAPMTRRMALEDGIPTADMVAYYARRARGEVGLIISEGIAIDDAHAWDTRTVPRFHNAAQLAGWRRVVEAVHAEGAAFAPQLWHTGPMARHPIGPSVKTMPARKDRMPERTVRAMTASDFEQVLKAYSSTAAAARDIGCDAVEIHGAHGYLLDSFVSPQHNQRTDLYGGSPLKRQQFCLEVVQAVREAVGPQLPIIYRFSQWRVDDFDLIKFADPDALRPWVCGLRDAGVDILHVSTHDATAEPFPEHGPHTLAGWTRKLAGIPVIAVGKVSATLTMARAYGDTPDCVVDPAPALALLDRSEADVLAVGRALIANPDWVPIVREGRWRELRPFDKAMLKQLD
jgi:2,4-dienoyl-CoA reductase-like NADH-dependent reductase (Old Yellow Enzyme family)